MKVQHQFHWKAISKICTARKNKTKQNKYIIIHIHIYIYIYKNQEIYISFTFSHVHEIYRELYMGPRRYGISPRVFNSISHAFAALTREMSSLTLLTLLVLWY